MYNDRRYGCARQYVPPDWATSLKVVPKSIIKLAQLPTPIHRWSPPGLPEGFDLFIKRDDLTGSTLSGNKVRKAEFIFAELKDKGCDCIVTVGGVHSNHARTMAVVAKEIGVEPHLLLFHKQKHLAPEAVGAGGNLLLDRLVGATILLHPYPEPAKVWSTYGEAMEKYCNKLRQEGRNPYSVIAGGATPIGAWGYIEAWREMMDQGVLDRFDDIVVCVGSGGTAVALAVANFLTGSKVKIHAVTVTRPSKHQYENLDVELKGLGVDEPSSSLLDVIDGYIGLGYGLNTEEELKKIVEVSTATGILLDHVFTVKTVIGMLTEMRTNPSRFKGHRVLYVHTGGFTGLFNTLQDHIVKSHPCSNLVSSFSE